MIKDVCYASFNCKDLEEAKAFLVDFGLIPTHETSDVVYFRGACTRPYIFIVNRSEGQNLLCSVGYEVDTEANLRQMAGKLNADVLPITGNPWGGLEATTRDCDGNVVNLVWGIGELAPLALPREEVQLNTANKIRRKGRFPLFDKENPMPVLHLDHVIHASEDPQRFIDWYVENLGGYPSDILMGPKKPVLSFIRFPDGQNYVPHHRVGVFNGKQTGVQHVCFESLDLDAVFMAHHFLRSRGYRQSWGPLRHSVGGAISDYWHTPFGLRVEHVTDGDMLNDDYETLIRPMSEETAMQWATQELPAEFLE